MSKSRLDPEEKAQLDEYRESLARAGHPMIAKSERAIVKYSPDQPRDEDGRFTDGGDLGSGAENRWQNGPRDPERWPDEPPPGRSDVGTPRGESFAFGEGKFGRSEGDVKINDDHRAQWYGSMRAGAFAQGYVSAQKEGMGRANGADEKRAEQFRKDYTVIGNRSGFVGSGETTYRHNATGAVFHVERMANGKGFWGTDHSISEMPADFEPRYPTGKSESKAEYLKSIARSGSTLMSAPDRVKYSDDQPRDENGRWTDSEAADTAAEVITDRMNSDPMWGQSRSSARLAGGNIGAAMHDLRVARTQRDWEGQARAMTNLANAVAERSANGRGQLQISFGQDIGGALADLYAARRVAAVTLPEMDRAIYGDKEAERRWARSGGPPTLYD